MDSNDLNSMNEETEDNELLLARSEINEVDEKMAELFIKRMDAGFSRICKARMAFIIKE